MKKSGVSRQCCRTVCFLSSKYVRSANTNVCKYLEPDCTYDVLDVLAIRFHLEPKVFFEIFPLDCLAEVEQFVDFVESWFDTRKAVAGSAHT